MSEKERTRLEELAAKGFSPGRIAQLMNRHKSTINWYMSTHGLKAPIQTDTPATYFRNGRAVRRFTRDEDEFITALRVEGHSTAEIARLSNAKFGNERSSHTIRGRLKMLASIEDAS